MATAVEKIVLMNKKSNMSDVNKILKDLDAAILNRIEKGYKDKHLQVPKRLRTGAFKCNTLDNHNRSLSVIPTSQSFRAFREGRPVSIFARAQLPPRHSPRPVGPVGRDSDSDDERVQILLSSDDASE